MVAYFFIVVFGFSTGTNYLYRRDVKIFAVELSPVLAFQPTKLKYKAQRFDINVSRFVIS